MSATLTQVLPAPKQTPLVPFPPLFIKAEPSQARLKPTATLEKQLSL